MSSFDLWRGESGVHTISSIQAHPNGRTVYVLEGIRPTQAALTFAIRLRSVDTTAGTVHTIGQANEAFNFGTAGGLTISGDGSRLYCGFTARRQGRRHIST